MKLLLRALLISLVFLPLGSKRIIAAQLQQPVPQPQLRETLRQLELDLREARGLASAVQDRNLRQKLEQVVARMEATRDILERQLAGLLLEPARVVVSNIELNNFLKALKAEPFDDKKGLLLRDFAKRNYFASGQAAVIVKQFSFGDGQTNAAIALHPRLLDPGNFYEVLAAITFDRDRDKVRKALGIK